MAKKYSEDEVMQLLASMRSGGNNTLPEQTAGGNGGTITQEIIPNPSAGSGGGSGGMDMLSGFTDLGDKIQKNALSTITMFSNMRNADRDRRRQTMQDAEAKRQFNVNADLATRDRNLNGMELLANIRNQAGQRSRQRSPFLNALGSAVR